MLASLLLLAACTGSDLANQTGPGDTTSPSTPALPSTPTATSTPVVPSTSVTAIASGTVTASTNKAKCIDVAGQNNANGVAVQVWGCTGNPNQNWTVTSAGELRVFSDKCLDSPLSTGGQNGDKLQIWSCSGGANQKWQLTSAGEIRGRNGKCVDITGGTATDGARLILYTCNGSAPQKWNLPTSSTPTTPTLQAVVLNPASASLQTGTTKQFAASGQMSDGTTSSVSVTWTATGGTISSSGLYTAGQTAGTFRVIATAASGGKADTAAVTLSTTTTTPPSTSCSSYGYSRLVSVSSASALSSALANAKPGDLIQLADGTYSGRFSMTVSGTSTQRIVVCGSRNAVINAGSTSSNDAISIKGSYWTLSGFTITNGLRGIIGTGAKNDIFTNLSIHDIGQAGIQLHSFSSNNTISYSTISNTGLRVAEYGEGIYLGSAVGQWGSNSGGQPDRSDNNKVLNNKIGPNVRAEGIDAKEGSTGGLVQGNTFDGHGMVMSQSWVDSWVEIKGNSYQVLGNKGTYSLRDGYQAYLVSGASGWGNNNVFQGNTSDLQSSGYGIRIASNVTGNVVRCDNTTTNAGSGMTNVKCQ